MTPAVTVFDASGKLDIEGNLSLYASLKPYVSGFIIMGSTGEFFALDMETSRRLIKTASQFSRGEMKAYAGASRMNIDECIELANYAYDCGLDGVMIISPWYFRLNEQDTYHFYSKIAQSTPANIFIYNFPDRTGYSISPALCLRLARENKNIIGFKDTITDTLHTSEIIRLVKSELPYFQVYAGYDNNFVHNILSGGDGCIGGLSNICPEFFHHWMNALQKKDLALIAEYQKNVDILMDIYAINDPFVPTLKKVLKQRGIIQSDRCTAPFDTIKTDQTESVQKILSRIGIDINA